MDGVETPHQKKSDLNQRDWELEKPAWALAKQVFNDALEVTGPERIKLVEEACGDDSQLLGLVVTLLQAHDDSGGFLSEPTWASPLPESSALLGDVGFAQFLGIDPDGPAGSPDSLAGKDLPARIGPYEILGVLGAGGMGTVYRARDPDLSRELAIKVLLDDLVSSTQLARFDREAKLLASLNHPNIATIHAIGETDGRPYLVLELIEGKSLSQKLTGGSLPVEEAVELGRQVAEAIGAAHEAGIVHRDLKPANVMITSRGLVKILDFGIAKVAGSGTLAPERMEITGDGTLVGTIPYMSPEQIVGEEVDEGSDLWALGCLLYEVLTGQSPFERSTTALTLVAIQKEAPDLAALPAGTPEALKGLISECLEKDPENRPVSAEVIRTFLSDTLTGLRGHPAGPWAERTPLSRAVWVTVGVLATITVLAVAEGSVVRTIIGWLPQGARLAVTDGGRMAAVVAMAVAALLFGLRFMGGIGPERIRRRIKTAAIGLAGVTGLALIYPLGSWLAAQAETLGSGALDVYVSLPFEGADDEGFDELLTISTHYRSTLETVFSDIESVRIMPAGYDPAVLLDYPPLCTFQRVEVWLSGSGFAPDLVLCNNVNVFPTTDGGRGLIVVSSLKKARGKSLDPIDQIKAEGTGEEVRYLALLACAQIVQTLHREQALQLASHDEETVLGRILDGYRTFLGLRPTPPSEVVRLVDELREADPGEGRSRVQDVIEVLGLYEPGVSLYVGEAQDQRNRDAILQRVGGSK